MKPSDYGMLWVIAGVVLLLTGLFSYLTGMVNGAESQKRRWEIECVQRGIAKWEVDSNGGVTFQFIESP